MLPLIALFTAPSWVLFSPIQRQLSFKAYEDGLGTAWASPEDFNLDRAAFRWSLPQSAYSDEALASGISFAIHKDFCARLITLFPENSHFDAQLFGDMFMSCDELRDAIKRGFDTWAINHKKIYFRDVSEECKNIESYDSCPAAEIWIVPDNEFASSNDLAAYVNHDTGNVDYAPYSTAGVQVAPGLGVRRARMAIRAPTAADSNDDFCWYLDSTFCYTFHRWKDDAVDIIMIARIVCVVLFVLALAVALWVLFQGVYAIFQKPVTAGEPGALRKKESVFHPSLKTSKTTQNMLSEVNAYHRKHTKGEGADLVCNSERMTSLVNYISVAPTSLLALAIFFLIFAPVFYFRIFVPCTACYDFEATIAHEVGHVLGFHHPDREKELNLKANMTMGPGVCTHPMDYVQLMTPPDTLDSIMYSMTRNRYETCLSNDDLEGLNFVYPVCEGAYTPIQSTSGELGKPLCLKSARLSGWLRLFYSVLFPTFIVNLIIFVLQAIVRRHQKNRMVSLEATADRLRLQRQQLMLRMKDRAESKVKERIDRARASVTRRGVGRSSVNTGVVRRVNRGPGESTPSTPRDGPAISERAVSFAAPMGEPVTAGEAQQRAEQLRQQEEIEFQQAIEASKRQTTSDSLMPPPIPNSASSLQSIDEAETSYEQVRANRNSNSANV